MNTAIGVFAVEVTVKLMFQSAAERLIIVIPDRVCSSSVLLIVIKL